MTLNGSKNLHPKITLSQRIDILSQEIARAQLMSGDRSFFYTPYIPTGVKPKYRFSRTNWYVAFCARLDGRLGGDTEVYQWCADNFGPMVRHPDAWSRWAEGAAWCTIRFRDEQDYIWFTLRWS